MFHILQQPPYLGAVMHVELSCPLIYKLPLALQEAFSDISGPPTSLDPVGYSLSALRREKGESVIRRVRLEMHRACPVPVKWIALPFCKTEIMD